MSFGLSSPPPRIHIQISELSPEISTSVIIIKSPKSFEFLLSMGDIQGTSADQPRERISRRSMVIVIIRHYKRAGEDPVHFPGLQARTHVEQKNQNQRHDHSLGLAHNSSSTKIGRGACRSLLDAPRSRCRLL